MPPNRPSQPQQQDHYLAHPHLGVVVALSGLIGIAIPMMDHKYTLLGFLICWGSTIAICILYFPEWKFGLRKLRMPPPGYVKVSERRPVARHALVSPIFAVVYFVAPILIFFDPVHPSQSDLVTQWGHVGPQRFRIGDVDSYRGARSSQMVANGELIQKTIGSDYELIGICFHHSHSGDVQDEPDISKSGPYDIESNQIAILIPWNDTFFKEFISGFTPTGYELLAVPTANVGKQFSMVRQAVALGAKRLARRSGPP